MHLKIRSGTDAGKGSQWVVGERKKGSKGVQRKRKPSGVGVFKKNGSFGGGRDEGREGQRMGGKFCARLGLSARPRRDLTPERKEYHPKFWQALGEKDHRTSIFLFQRRTRGAGNEKRKADIHRRVIHRGVERRIKEQSMTSLHSSSAKNFDRREI